MTSNLDRPTQNRGIAAEAPLPEVVAEDQRAGRNGDGGIRERLLGDRLLVGLHETPPEQRLHAEHLEVVGGDAGELDLLGLTLPGEGRLGHVVGRRKTKEAFRLLPVVGDVGGGHGSLRVARGLHAVPDQHQPLGLVVGERSNEDRVDRAEDGGVGADPQRQREDRYEGEARAVRELAPAVPQVCPERSHHPDPSRKNSFRNPTYNVRRSAANGRMGASGRPPPTLRAPAPLPPATTPALRRPVLSSPSGRGSGGSSLWTADHRERRPA